MSDPEVVDLTVAEDKKKTQKLDLAKLAREREARRRSRGDDGDDGGDAKRPRVASTPAAPTGDAPSLRAGWFTRSGMARAQQQQITFPCPTVSLQIREQRQRRGCVAQKLAPEAAREAPGPLLRDRLRGLVAGPFEGEGRALE